MRGIITKVLLVAFICIFGSRTERIQIQDLIGGSGSSVIFVESFSLEPLFVFQRKCKWAENACCKVNHRSSHLFGGIDSDAAKALQEKAAALRREVEALEASKQEESDQLQKEIEEKKRQAEELRLRYSAEVPILKGDGTVVMERCDFPPRMTEIPDGDEDDDAPRSRIIAIQAPLPLGIVLGQDEELPLAQRPTTVDDVAEGGNGEQAGVRVGDCLRACTACQVTMEQPTWQLMAGGIGRPKTTRMMFSTDNEPFEQVMNAIASNTMDPESRDVWLVIERMDE